MSAMETWCFPSVASYVGVCKIPEHIRKFQLSLQDGEFVGEVSLLYGRPGFSLAFCLWFTIILKAHVLNLYSNIGHLKRHLSVRLF